jgi:type II secretory pathway pseudopilin PulG
MRIDSPTRCALLTKQWLRALHFPCGQGRRETGFTLVEVMISAVIVALVFATIINGYLFGAKRLQWSAYSLAAQAASVELIEQTRSAQWDITISKNEVAGLALSGYSSNSTAQAGYVITGYTTNILDVPWKGTNFVLATNYVTITLFSENNATNLPVQLQMVRVDTVWPFNNWGNFKAGFYTNTTSTYLAPDNP